MMQLINSEGLKERGHIGFLRRRPRNKAFSSEVKFISLFILTVISYLHHDFLLSFDIFMDSPFKLIHLA